MPDNSPPTTVVLVHGAFADAGSFADVAGLLLEAGIPVVAPANPLRGIAIDSAYIAGVFTQIPGPVLAVGHSYGGAVITNAATGAPNVKGLVFVAAFAPDENEVLGAVAGTSEDSVLGPALVQRTYPIGGAETAIEFYVNQPAFREVFASDLPDARAALLAASQRPVAAAAFDEPSGVPAWKSLPTWAVVATGDKAAGTDLTLSMATRAGAQITEVQASHVVMISRPAEVTAVITAALAAIS